MTDLARGLDATLSIVKAAGTVIGHTDTLVKAKRFGENLTKLNATTSSLASYSAQTTILSRMYIEESLLDEIVIPNLTKSIHEWYVAQIISSLGLSRMVEGVGTVQDVMSLVQTGHTMREKSLGVMIANRALGLESFTQSYTGESSYNGFGLEALNGDGQLGFDFKDETQYRIDRLERERNAAVLSTQEANANVSRQKEHFKTTGQALIDKHEEEMDKIHHKYKDFGTSNVSVKSVETSKHKIGPMGELYEVKLSSGKEGAPAITVPVFIQMQPSMVPTDIAPRFIDMNVHPTLWQRWTMRQAGEITFWKDFVFQADLARRHQSMLKDPRQAKAMAEFHRTIANKDKYALADVTDKSGRRQSSNLANSVVVFSESTVMQAKADSGIDLHNAKDRERYFRQTYTMMIVVIDPVHQRVTVYFHGVDGDINVSYNEFRPRDKNFEPKDMMAALQAFSTNTIGRLR